MQSTNTDTIAALATPPGRGGIAVIRISGPQVKDIIRKMLGGGLTPNQAVYLPFCDASGEWLDQGIAIFFQEPHSFTGEDVLELQGHGGPVVVNVLLERILQLGARLAHPGEFTERAFLNGKMDLAQAEAVADLIDASSKEAARCAMRSLQGEFSREIHALNEKIIRLRMYLEAAIDFADEEIDFLNDETIAADLESILNQLTSIMTNAKQGSLLRDGVSTVIVGEPNVGKSSLLNWFTGKDTAIVADIPGTTRDVLRDTILLDGMPMHIIDTAGLRESEDVVEQEGLRRAYREMDQADIVLYMMDVTRFDSANHIQHHFSQPVIFIHNKIDLINVSPSVEEKNGYTTIALSVKLGLGMDLLKQHIKTQIGFQSKTEGVYLARSRHLDALKRTKIHINNSLKQLAGSKRAELAAEDLRLAQQALCEITGEFTADDLLGCLFSSFCIGK